MSHFVEIEENPVKETRKQRLNGLAYFRLHRSAKWILAGMVTLLGVASYWAWSHYSIRESTDDAQIAGHIVEISAKVGGTVLAVNVNDNEKVKEDAVLIQIDPKDYEVALERTQADEAAERANAASAQAGVPITAITSASRLRTASAGVQSKRAALVGAQKKVEAARAERSASEAQLREARAEHQKASVDLARMKTLIASGDISPEQYDAAVAAEAASRATFDAAQAFVTQAEKAESVAASDVTQARAALLQAEATLQAAQTAPEDVAASRARVGNAQAKIQQAEAAARQARLNLAYTTVRAPVNGIVSNKAVEVGQVVQAGQALLALVPLEDIWVTANFKETQLNQIRPGQKVVITVDAYGHRKYRGYVDSVAAATGEQFSLLPPENATGNFVKVVQRVPVKIVFEKGQDPEHLLRPGLSVEVTVITK